LRKLERIVSGKNHLLIVIHNNPDPDAIMSGAALSHLVEEKYGLETSISYGGDIGRAENRALLSKLGIKLKQFNRIHMDKYDVVACVDTQPGAGNNMLSADSTCNIVIDHHKALPETDADLVVVRPDLGGTATILVEWLKEAGVPVTPDLATGLAYAISSETQSMGRETTGPDIEAYLSVYVKANLRKLSQIMFPKLPRDYFVLVARALQQARLYRNFVCSHLREIPASEIVAEMADFLVRQERISWAICTGRFKDRLILSLRSTNTEANAGQLARKLVESDHLAGGHGMTGGGFVPIEGEDEEGEESLEERFTAKFLKLMGYPDADWKPLLGGDGSEESGNRKASRKSGQ
jgi:nanoRNase/pAp phosphatase (c-di-AMP/oligoRNAs hydrolase)